MVDSTGGGGAEDGAANEGKTFAHLGQVVLVTTNIMEEVLQDEDAESVI